jgi:protoporphyrinogen oxidase
VAQIGIIGGGIAGLATAWRLAGEGHRVELLESTGELGGLGAWFQHGDLWLDKYYHVMLDSDDYLVDLLRELGLAADIVWTGTGMGFMVRGRLYPFNTPVDLLRFGAVPFHNRIRTGLGALYVTKLRNGLALDKVRAVDWLPRVFGEAVFRGIWEPLLTAKFGDLRDRVPAYWIWNTLNREKDGGPEVKGYLRGGYRRIGLRLAEAIEALGGRIEFRSPVRSVEDTPDAVIVEVGTDRRRYDAVVSTLPPPALRQIARGTLAHAIPVADLDFQGCVNVLLVLNQRLSPHYWTAVVDSDFAFQGIVETTHVIPADQVGGKHIVYVMNYCRPGTEPYDRTDELASRQAIEGLERLYPGFSAAHVEASYVFRAPRVEPVWTVGYLEERPAPRIDGTRVYQCTTAQAYPMVTSWNTSAKLALDTVNAIRRDIAAPHTVNSKTNGRSGR